MPSHENWQYFIENTSDENRANQQLENIAQFRKKIFKTHIPKILLSGENL